MCVVRAMRRVKPIPDMRAKIQVKPVKYMRKASTHVKISVRVRAILTVNPENSVRKENP
jgi:hypothetical protein